ncbi:MAG: hypothetical protein AAGK74_00690 [Chloroflexota bacterium]
MIVALVALVIAAIVLLGLYLQARSNLQEETMLATAAVEQAEADSATAQASFDGLQQTSEAIYISATEAAETAIAEIEVLEGDVEVAEGDIAALEEQATQSAGTAVAQVDALGTQVAVEAATATRDALSAVSTIERFAFEQQRDIATSGAVAADGTRVVSAARATATRSAAQIEQGAATAGAVAAEATRSVSVARATDARADDLATREAATAVAQVSELEAQAASAEQAASDVAARATIAAEINALDAAVADEVATSMAEDAAAQQTEIADMTDQMATQGAEAAQVEEEIASAQTEVAALNDQQATADALIATQSAQLAQQSTQMADPPTEETPELEPTEAPLLTAVPSGTELPPSTQTGDTDAIEGPLSTLSILPRDLAFIDGIDSFSFDLSNEDNVIVGEPFVSNYGDFVTAVTMAWGDGAAEDYCGFIFRRDETGDNYYTVEIDRRGSVRYFIRTDGEWVPGESNSSSNAVATDVDDLNDLILVAQGNSFIFFVNGEEVLAMTDETHSESGGVSIMSGTFEGSDDSGCTFTNAGIWDLSAPIKE